MTTEPRDPARTTAAADSSGARRVRLLVLDVDGTVADSRHRIAAETAAAVAAARRAGIVVVLATGRRYRDVRPVALELGLDGPIVTASGALVKRLDDHATLFRAAFGPDLLAEVVGTVVDLGHEPILYTDSFADGFDFHCRRLPDPGAGSGGIDEYLERNRPFARVDARLHETPPAGTFAGFAMGSRHRMDALADELLRRCPGLLSLHVIRSPRYRDWMCEIAPSDVTKWSGVASLAAEAGIAPAEVCAVGDDVNDLPMIRGAGLGVAMGNACDEVKRVADLVVRDNDSGGVVELVEFLLRGRP